MKELFIGCSKEGLSYARKLKELLNERLQKYNIKCVLWNDDGVFLVGKTTIESLYKKANELKRSEGYAVMLMTPDDKIEFRGKTRYAPRDNIVFELGLFIGCLGRNRTYCIAPSNNKVRMMSDWFGVTNATYQYTKRPREENLEERLILGVNRIVKTIDGVETPKENNNSMNKNIFQIIEKNIEKNRIKEGDNNGFIHSIN